MATKTADSHRRKDVVVMDRDGVVIDDISMEFGRHFREGDSLLKRALEEFTFISLSIISTRIRVNALDRHTGMDESALKYMKREQDEGKAIVVKTANMNVDILKEESVLRAAGIDAEVKHTSMLSKLDRDNPYEKRLIEDNQLATFAALIRTHDSDKRITLVKKDYNSITGFFIKLFGKHSRLDYASLDKLED